MLSRALQHRLKTSFVERLIGKSLELTISVVHPNINRNRVTVHILLIFKPKNFQPVLLRYLQLRLLQFFRNQI